VTVAAEERVFVGLGANLGDARAAVRQAILDLDTLPETRCVGHSRLYRSAPIEAGGPDFVNAVAELRSELEPEALLEALHRLETRAGRARPYVNAPRTLDLDLLLFGQRQRAPLANAASALALPHPRLHRRAFVLHPLLELAPDLMHPQFGCLADWLPGVAGQRIEALD
jgi:2-amino-4-hydroxy-6-hydroxymethyldihydropteridine diphosphokinase